MMNDKILKIVESIQVHSPKRISHTTNIKLEPYSVVSDTSIVPTDYTSVASNESFYDTSHILDGRPVFGPWPKPILPMKSHSDSNQVHKLTQCIEHDMKKSSSDTTMDIAIHCGKSSKEINTTTISIPVAGKYDIATQKLSENNLNEGTAAISHGQISYNTAILKSGDILDEAKSEHSIHMITDMVSPNEQNKLHFEQFQQRLTSLATPFVSILGARIGTTGESSTDEDLGTNETDNVKKLIGTLQSVSQSIKSKGTYDEIEIDDELTVHSSSYFQQKRIADLPLSSSISSVAEKTQKLMDATYQTALSQEDIHLLSDTIEQQCNDNNNNSNNANLMKKYANELMLGIGKILRKENGGIAALYKHTLERPDSRFSKILYSMIA
ncbi:unnamed protein product [Cercopithifilaria johnstoni]|uniref:Uncharacterized protein n=1 Tax=Cercopithifilaria johnstoni TaxID=2874296 RepID=A0A8J2LYY7_9BILA|nr:unnamed protein product [Cercopithifilaria johnstoni]